MFIKGFYSKKETECVKFPDNSMPGLSQVTRNLLINDNRQIVGGVSISPGGTNPFLWTEAGGMLVLPNLPNASICAAYGINNIGQVVGECSMSGLNHSFLWKDGVLTDLNELVDPASEWWISEARAINDQGQIVGHGINPDGNMRGFVLSRFFQV